jgi:hypothetical protein
MAFIIIFDNRFMGHYRFADSPAVQRQRTNDRPTMLKTTLVYEGNYILLKVIAMLVYNRAGEPKAEEHNNQLKWKIIL